MITKRLVAAALLILAATVMASDTQLDSWYTTLSGQYARIYTTSADQTSGTTYTTWNRGAGVQTSPAYSGVIEVSYSSSWMYVRTTGLGFHNMGPWYLDANKTQLFPNYPKNSGTLWRFPRTPVSATSSNLTSLGAIGYFVDGVAMFDGQDGYYWNVTAEAQSGTGGLWNRDAFPEEGVSFDPANAHQEQSGMYHYHANPLALRYQLGDNVSYNTGTKKWVENVAAPTKHSPLIGWVKDGHPIYGPYGYSSQSNSLSGIRRMTTGYTLRNGTSNTVNLASTGRITLPAWAARAKSRSATLSSGEYGPGVTNIYTIGRYHEDYEYMGDVGKTKGTDFDLDEHNGRYCVTPEYPNGTYAYFMTINSSGTPVYPYNIGRVFHSSPVGGSVTTLTETITTNFLGGANATLKLGTPVYTNSKVVLTWSATEGGTYKVESKTNLSDASWTTVSTTATPVKAVGTITNTTSATQAFYKVTRTALATYDTTGSTTVTVTPTTAPGGTATRSTTVQVTITLPSSPPNPPTNATVGSAVIGGSITATTNSYTTSGVVVSTFTIPANATTGAQNVVVSFTSGPTYTLTGGITIN
ncbi:MAG TPA: YHYH protein [Roseimicrobium sp.]|nr:YHYH protein [Roseimicrobium sp.]